MLQRPYFLVIVMATFILNQAFTGPGEPPVFTEDEAEVQVTADTGAIPEFERYIQACYASVFPDSSLSYDIFRYALIGQCNLHKRGKLVRTDLLSIIDFSKPSSEERLYIINMRDTTLMRKSLVAHGIRTGNTEARYFSNSPGSKKSSIGFFVTGETYNGKHRYSLKLDGQDPYYNTNARNRGIVVHGADYVSHEYLERNGRLGRSFGCPAIPKADNTEIVDLLTGGTCVFVYASSQSYLGSSRHLNLECAARHYLQQANALAASEAQARKDNS